MNRDYSGLINSTNKAMMEKLKENEHKRSFDDVDFNHAIMRIYEECSELDVEIDQMSKKGFTQELLVNVRKEAADVCNFAAMIILKCDKLIDAMESK